MDHWSLEQPVAESHKLMRRPLGGPTPPDGAPLVLLCPRSSAHKRIVKEKTSEMDLCIWWGSSWRPSGMHDPSTAPSFVG